MRNFIIKTIIILIIPILTFNSFSQSISQKVNGFGGGDFKAGNKSISWTMGEPVAKTFSNGNHKITSGFQQPEIAVKILNFKTYIEGFYAGNGLMRPVLFNNSLNTDSTACDSVIVELHESTMPYQLVTSKPALLHSNGSLEVKFPSSLKYGLYFIAIRTRNAVETWSKNPVTIGHSTVFDFRY